MESQRWGRPLATRPGPQAQTVLISEVDVKEKSAELQRIEMSAPGGENIAGRQGVARRTVCLASLQSGVRGELDLEDQIRVRWDVWRAPIHSVAEGGRHVQPPDPAGLHPRDPLLPALNQTA